MANKHEITARDTKIIEQLLSCIDPVAVRMYKFLFEERNECSSQVSTTMRNLARALHTREENVSRSKRVLRALGLIKDEHYGKYGRTRFTVRPYCSSHLRTLFDASEWNVALTLKSLYRHLKLHESNLRDEYTPAFYTRSYKGHRYTQVRRKAAFRWNESKQLNLTPEVVELPLSRYLPELRSQDAKPCGPNVSKGAVTGTTGTVSSSPEVTDFEAIMLQVLDAKGRTDATDDSLEELLEFNGWSARLRSREVTKDNENQHEEYENKSDCGSSSEISLLVNTYVFDLYKLTEHIVFSHNRQIKNFMEVTRKHKSEFELVPSELLASPEDLIKQFPSEGFSGLPALVLIPAAGVAFLNDDSRLVFVGGRWLNHDAQISRPVASGQTNGLKVMVGAAEVVIRAGNTSKLNYLWHHWKEMSAYEATYMVWETYNEATAVIPTVFLSMIPGKVRDGQGRRHKTFMLAFNWVTSNFSKWGELWFQFLAGIETNAMLRGSGPAKLNIKSKPSFSWVFSNPNPTQVDIRIDRYLKGEFRWSELKPDGSAKYYWLNWPSKESDAWKEVYGDPDYGDIKV